MTRWRASTKSMSIGKDAVFQVVAEMHIIGRPSQIVMGDAFIIVAADESQINGVIATVTTGMIVARMDNSQTFHLRPRSAADPESGFPQPRGKSASDWVVARVS